jgi:hypothetical protein
VYNLIETSEKIEFSLPMMGAKVLSILNVNGEKMTIYDLLDKTYKSNQDYGDNRVIQTLVFLYALKAINLNGVCIEVNNDNS